MDRDRRAADLAALARGAAAQLAPVVADTGWRQPATTRLRVLVFAIERLIIVVEATRDRRGLRVDGFIRPAPNGAGVVRLRRSNHPGAPLGRNAHFALTDLSPGPTSLLFEDPAAAHSSGLATEWVTL